MRRVAEVIYVVPEEREAYMNAHLNPSERVAQILWIHGIRNQCFYALNDVLLLCFEYVGKHFYEDMAAIAAYPEMKDYLVQTRRRDVPADQQLTTNWWAPLKRLGSTLTESPMPDDEDEGFTLEEQYRSMISGEMVQNIAATNDISFDEDDWSESIHI
ncbi:MAG TPA: L-rhamnose mutarotase [Candidatus Scatomonas pullistercoris]|uniref:L-rhamnose mutarotase n=1 Tax=Candidatus Scatomonas pullistercoris TaxID=2840920 RepID=A0A9D1TA51_9FIRM|nr:L-rhamnose mutarotase [Candidatus Scatomonas pullistercoris]